MLDVLNVGDIVLVVMEFILFLLILIYKNFILEFKVIIIKIVFMIVINI